jgi:regulator of protease activity HflC (stomatin/prohibitin superfamily)
VITEDNLVVSIDTVVYFQVTDPKAATYEISSYILGIEQLTVTTLRNVIGSMDLEETLTSRDAINGQLRGVLDEATGKWGIRVNRVELKAIDPPPSVQESMEKQLKAERERRAAILTAEGQKQSAILTAEGAKQSAILTAQGEAEAAVLRADAEAKAEVIRAEGEAAAVEKIYAALHEANPTSAALAHRYLDTLPEIANGEASKVWVLPSELTSVVNGLKEGFAK